jgi:hypothetical protein
MHPSLDAKSAARTEKTSASSNPDLMYYRPGG